ncbi:hypothetical protein YN1_7910 [Nanoarchaeota archaeon]
MEKYFEVKIGKQAKEKGMIIRNSLPLYSDINDLVKLNLKNANKLSIEYIRIEFIPIWRVRYYIYKKIRLPDRSRGSISGTGVLWINALDGSILSEKNIIIKSINDIVSKDIFIPLSENLEVIDHKKYEYCNRESLFEKIKEILSYKYTTELRYRKRRDEEDAIIISPTRKDINLEFYLIKVPIIVVVYSYKNVQYKRMIFGHNMQIIEDGFSYCSFFSFI